LSVSPHFSSTGQAALTSTSPLVPSISGIVLHSDTSWSRNSSPAYWRLLKTVSCSCWRVKRLPGRPSVPLRRCSTIFSPRRVRSDRAARSSPMIRANPSSGCFGFDSQ
jgi:hypothetical protein